MFIQGPTFIFLANFPGPTFIPCHTSIPESRVCYLESYVIFLIDVETKIEGTPTTATAR